MSDDARFRKGFLLALVVAITAAFVFVIKDFLMTIFVAAIFSGLAHPLYRRCGTIRRPGSARVGRHAADHPAARRRAARVRRDDRHRTKRFGSRRTSRRG